MDEETHFKQYMSVRNSITLLVQQYVGIRSTEKRKTPHATEEKSKSHETKTENVNTDKMQGVYLRSCKPVWQYSQVYDGDYYYLVTDGNWNYTVMKNKEPIGKFLIPKGGIMGTFAVEGDKAYAIIYSMMRMNYTLHI